MCKQPILACITAQEHCVNIVDAAKQMANNLKAPLIVATCQPIKCDAKRRSEDLKILNEISKKCDVQITICYGEDAASVIAAQAKKLIPLHIFLGKDNGFLTEFRKEYSLAPVSIVTDNVLCTIPAEDIMARAN